MARVSHKKINRLVYTDTYQVNEQEFFTSKEFTAYLQDILDIISQAYQTKKFVRVQMEWDEADNASVARTNADKLFINAGTHLMKNVADRAERFEGVLGLMLHENGHLLFTNFAKSNEVYNEIMRKHLIMIPSKKYSNVYEAYEKVRDCLTNIKNRHVLSIIANIWTTLENCLEDGHIDWRIGDKYPGYKSYLEFINDLCYDNLPSIADIKKNRNKKIQENPDEPVFMIYDFLQYLLLYSRYGYLKGEDWEIVKEEAAMKIYDMIDWIDFAKETKNSIERIMYQSIVFYLAFPFDYVEALLLKYGNEDTSTVDQNTINNLQEVLNNAQSSNNRISSSDSKSSSLNLSGTIIPAGDNESDIQNSDKQSNDEKKSSVEMKTGSENKNIYSENNTENTPNNIDDKSQNSTNNCEESVEVTEKEKNPDYNKMCCGNKKNCKSKREKDFRDVSNDMQRVLDKMSKNHNFKIREQHLQSELNSFAASIKHKDIHKGIECEVRRIDVPCENLITNYQKIWPQLSSISKKLQGRLEKQLEKQRKGYKQNNLYFGRKLEASNLVRNDGKYFSKKQLPNNKKKLAVGILVDESGSMASADRITYARMTSLIVYDFCNKLGIPISVYGHSAGHYPEVRLNAYAEFNAVDKNDRYRIMSMDCSGCNRDGYALRYMAERLHTQNAEIKLLFIISDGKPNSRGYKDEDAFEDLASIKKEYYNKNIITIAAAIGDDKKIIEHIYGKEAFLDVTDLNELPKNLISIIKNFL